MEPSGDVARVVAQNQRDLHHIEARSRFPRRFRQRGKKRSAARVSNFLRSLSLSLQRTRIKLWSTALAGTPRDLTDSRGARGAEEARAREREEREACVSDARKIGRQRFPGSFEKNGTRLFGFSSFWSFFHLTPPLLSRAHVRFLSLSISPSLSIRKPAREHHYNNAKEETTSSMPFSPSFFVYPLSLFSFPLSPPPPPPPLSLFPFLSLSVYPSWITAWTASAAAAAAAPFPRAASLSITLPSGVAPKAALTSTSPAPATDPQSSSA